jgi:replicative DNA helicase
MSSTRRTDAPPRRPLTELMDRQPPFDLQAEIGVLGSIVLLPDVLDDIVMILRPDDFYDDAHRLLFVHMTALHESGKKIDDTLLVNRLKTAGEYEKIGGAAYLSKIINAVPNAAHATYYADIVREKATYRSLIYAATEILRDAYDESQEAAHLLSQSEQKIFSILDNRSDSAVKDINRIVLDAMERLDARMSGSHTAGGCDFGFRDLDGKTAGLHEGELVILAARPSMGKTAFAMNVAENVCLQQNIPVLFVSLEMSSLELADRLLCSVARVNGHRLRNGTVSQEDRIRLVDTAGTLSRVPLFVDDSPSRTVTEIAAAARRIKRRHGSLGLIVIDYLQLIEPDNPKDPRQEQVAKIARRLKGMAREMKVPVMCLAQLNRQTEAGKESHIPRLSHLRESGAIEQDADVVMFVHRESYYQRGEGNEDLANQAQIIIAKQRNGPVGDVDLEWLRDFTRFQDPVPERLKEFDQYNDRQMVDPSAGF